MRSKLYKKLFFVYKITVTGSRLNYVGVTNNYDQRRAHHVKSIYEAMLKMKKGRKKIECKIWAQYKIAEYLFQKFGHTMPQIWNITAQKLKVRIIDIFDHPGEAKKCEHENILKGTKYGLNLNMNKYSSYCFGTDFTIIHPIKKEKKKNGDIIISCGGSCRWFSTK